MKGKDVVRRVSELALPICKEAGVTLWDVAFEKEGQGRVLSVYIDRGAGVFIEDCERVSRALDPLLDAPEFDGLPSYTLSVSSAGLERKLTCKEHLEWALGKPVTAGFYQAVDGSDSVTGVLLKHDRDHVELRVGGEPKTLKMEQVAYLRLHVDF